MKKKLLIILLLVFICTGCNGNVTRTIRKSGFNVSGNKFKCDTIMPSKGGLFSEKKTSEKISFMSGNTAISNNGNVYEFSFNGVFSNNMNCKKVMSGIKVTSVIDNEVLRDVNGKYYYLSSDNNTVLYSEVPAEDEKLGMYSLILGDGHVLKAMCVNSNINSYYVLKDDGNIYNYVIKQDDNTRRYSIVSNNTVYNYSKFKGKVLDFRDYGESAYTYFRTGNSIYRMINTNANECSKYVDVACKYELKRDDTLSEAQDKLVAFSGNMLITDYGRVFTIGS